MESEQPTAWGKGMGEEFEKEYCCRLFQFWQKIRWAHISAKKTSAYIKNERNSTELNRFPYRGNPGWEPKIKEELHG
jgi:hypothetical protein